AYNSALVAVDVLSRDLGRGMEIASDILLNPSFPPDEVDKEKDKQLKAIQAERDQVMAVCRNLLRKNFYGDAHPYAMNPLGREDTLRAIGPEDLRAFHRALCAGSNTVIAVFGDVDPAAVRKMARDHFGAMPRGDAPPIPRIDPPATATQPRRAEETMDKSQAVIQIGFPGVAIDSPDRFAMEVLTEALADMGSRLFIRIREEQGLAYFVGAAQSIGLIPGHFVLYAGTSPEKADAVVTDLLAEAAKLRESGLTEEEIARAKTKLIAAQQMAKQKNGNYAYAVALDELYGLGAGFEQAYADRVRAVTPAQVAEVARRHLLEDRCVIAIVRPPR
ncbi:MAG: insulinase family protein, partial [Verrucomicrobiae bacterium]|nr:insulinase family protein [Verrucomicrobiae bacterium]